MWKPLLEPDYIFVEKSAVASQDGRAYCFGSFRAAWTVLGTGPGLNLL